MWIRYRHQLEAFVDKVRGREPKAWVSADDSAENMHWIEQMYAKVGLFRRFLRVRSTLTPFLCLEQSGLNSRPASTFVPAA